MFFIMGISQKEKKLDFQQLAICSCCGRYGQVEVYMTYTYFMFFFIPLFKWNKRYFVRMACCGETAMLDDDTGAAIASGENANIDLDKLSFSCGLKQFKRCSNCGFSTSEDFKFCPECGHPFE
ncbi:zinc-ribbon family protein [Dethiosulfatibacter aminovorans DSM 17477]|uniref:Zinc-ribbon family protein n=1 Tax=Dethiosulfatibacter aminovorans DSM 17477 TaxID=1121476 RepID=A0A1M6JLY3_9FIRM|nr:zinc ribbon domain-containing protein [Dethiosulfatibacter aminovorans]SHJ47644.1 zinc-ribbon family protein [Dethiosulfatibacter aminovorans DSM 17477]